MVVQWLGVCLPLQRVGVQLVTRELGSHMPHGQKTKTQNRGKFNKDFKENGPHQKEFYK